MRTAQSRVWLGQKQSRGYQLYGMGGGGAQSHRDKQFEHIRNHILTDGLGLSLNTPSLSSVSGSSTNECKPVQVCQRGSARRASQNSWKKYSSRQPTAAAPLQPITVSHRGDTPCEVQTRVRARRWQPSRVLLSNIGVPGTH